jgi:hypothetical protein
LGCFAEFTPDDFNEVFAEYIRFGSKAVLCGPRLGSAKARSGHPQIHVQRSKLLDCLNDLSERRRLLQPHDVFRFDRDPVRVVASQKDERCVAYGPTADIPSMDCAAAASMAATRNTS